MDKDDRAEKAEQKAHRAEIMSVLWWLQVPIITIVYWMISKEPPIEKVILTYLADVSIIANAVSYATKAKALRSEAAGYSNP